MTFEEKLREILTHNAGRIPERVDAEVSAITAAHRTAVEQEVKEVLGDLLDSAKLEAYKDYSREFMRGHTEVYSLIHNRLQGFQSKPTEEEG